MESYRELVVWQKAMSLVKAVYQIARVFPKEETYVLSDQIHRAAVSVPSNVAEGFGRGSGKDYAHFLSIAKSSLYEVDTQIRVAIMLGFIADEQAETALALCEECGRMLNSMIQKIGNK